MSCEDIVKAFFNMSLTIKLYHWQTTQFSRHKASDELFSGLLDLIDTFIEVFIGRYKRPKFDSKISIVISETSDEEMINTLKKYIMYLKNKIPTYLKTDDTDLLNIRDEMLQLLNKTVYLFTLQ
jgi:hypothetical protein